MRKAVVIFFVVAFVVLTTNRANAQQDPNFTLYNFNMNIINPAYAGIKDSPELNLVYRSQYIGIEDAPRTASLAYSRPLMKNLGLGVSLINDHVFVLTQTDLAVDVSYKVQLSERTKMYFGLKGGGGFTNVDLTKANARENDPLFAQNQSFFNPHIGAGFHLQNEKIYISISTPNLLSGNRYEKKGNAPTAATEKPHYYIGGGYYYNLTDNLVLTPMLMIRVVEGGLPSYDVGSSLEVDQKFTGGVNLRLDEMISVYGLVNLNNKLKSGVAYDLTISNVSMVNDGGSIEFILKYQF